MKPPLHLLIFLTLLGFLSCKKENRWDCLKRTGDKMTEARRVPPFTRIYVADNINVFVTQDSIQEIKIEAGKNLIPLIRAEVVNEELRLTNDNRCNWTRSYKEGTINVYIKMPELKFVMTDGTGKFSGTDTIQCKVLDLWTKSAGDIDLTIYAEEVYMHMHSTADVTLRGYASMQGVYHTGQGILNSKDLYTIFTWTYSNSTGNEYLYAVNSLWTIIDWVGDVYYKGDPTTLETKGKGKGKLIKDN